MTHRCASVGLEVDKNGSCVVGGRDAGVRLGVIRSDRWSFPIDVRFGFHSTGLFRDDGHRCFIAQATVQSAVSISVDVHRVLVVGR